MIWFSMVVKVKVMKQVERESGPYLHLQEVLLSLGLCAGYLDARAFVQRTTPRTVKAFTLLRSSNSCEHYFMLKGGSHHSM